jgi:MYXO-CTERM domain-containing protein
MEGVSMKTLAFRRTIPALVFVLAAIMAVSPISGAFAQAPTVQPGQSPPAARTDTDDDAGNWGLLGLIGLLGLAGLMRRDRAQPSDRPAERAGRP